MYKYVKATFFGIHFGRPLAHKVASQWVRNENLNHKIAVSSPEKKTFPGRGNKIENAKNQEGET